MLCIELSRNGERLATAGLPGKGVLSVIFDRVLSDAYGPVERRNFRLGGLDASTEPNSSLHWVGGDVEVGDEFAIRFFQGESADPPKYSEPEYPRTPAKLRRFRQRQLRNLEAEVKKVRALLATKKRNKGSKRTQGRRAAPARTGHF